MLLRPRVHLLVGEPLLLTGDPGNLHDVREATATITAAIEVLRGARRPGTSDLAA